MGIRGGGVHRHREGTGLCDRQFFRHAVICSLAIRPICHGIGCSAHSCLCRDIKHPINGNVDPVRGIRHCLIRCGNRDRRQRGLGEFIGDGQRPVRVFRDRSRILAVHCRCHIVCEDVIRRRRCCDRPSVYLRVGGSGIGVRPCYCAQGYVGCVRGRSGVKGYVCCRLVDPRHFHTGNARRIHGALDSNRYSARG